MKTLLVVLNIAAFAVSFGAILWAWLAVRRDIRQNSALLARLKEIEQEYANEPALPFGGGNRLAERKAAERAAGKTMFMYGDIYNMPERVKELIYSNAISGLSLQVWLVGLGLAIGTAANVLSLYV